MTAATGAAAGSGGQTGTLSASLANIGPGNSPQANADVTVNVFNGGSVTFRATLSAGTYGAGAKGFTVFKNGGAGAGITPADSATCDATVSDGDTIHYQATKGGTSGTSWNATITISIVETGQTLGTFTANVTAP